MSALKRGLKVFIIVIIALIVIVAIYVLYVVLSYSRIPDNSDLKVSIHLPAKQNTVVDYENDLTIMTMGTEYTAVTSNVGFGAYNHDFSFFMDEGFMKDGKKTVGTMSRAESLQVVKDNTRYCMDAVTGEDPDIVLFQEVDVSAHRSRGYNQRKAMTQSFSEYLVSGGTTKHPFIFQYTYATNFHSAYLFYPITKPIGQIRDSGLLTMSKYKIDSSVRRSFPIDESFPTKFFDLDRCFSVNRMPINDDKDNNTGKELVLINTHMSAYDKGGTVRKAQMEFIAEVMEDEYKKGNWVITGGDFNHAIGGSETMFMNEMLTPPWVQPFANDKLPSGFRIVVAENNSKVATVRDSSIPFEKGVNYETVLDGFIVSDNIDATAFNIDANYRGSDHNPARLKFTLKG